MDWVESSKIGSLHCQAGGFYELKFSCKIYLETIPVHPAKVYLMSFAIIFEIHSPYCELFKTYFESEAAQYSV